MEIMEQAEAYVWDYMQAEDINTERMSDTGTVENLMNDGWTPSEIVAGKADNFILDNICWID